MVVAVEVHDSQTAKGAFGSDAVADGVGDADAIHAAGTTAVESSKSLKQIFAEGPNFAATGKSGQDQGRLHLTLDLFREVLITKEVCQSSESCRSRFVALVNAGIRGERVMDDRAQIFKALSELYKSCAVDEEARRVRSRVRLTWRWKVYRFGFGCRGAAAYVHLKAGLAKLSEDVTHEPSGQPACSEERRRPA